MVKALIVCLVFGFVTLAHADSLYLKNGRNIEGLIRSEDKDAVDLEVCQGVIKVKRNEIEKIEKSSSREVNLIRQKWERQKIDTQNKILKQQQEEEGKPKSVEFSLDSQTISVGVKINNKVEATLVLDTGASLVMLRKQVAEKLGFRLDGAKADAKLTLADGRQVNAKHIILESIKAQGIEAENVEAAVLLEDVANANFGDGLLGMSFLKRFNFKVDHRERRLILEKLYQ